MKNTLINFNRSIKDVHDMRVVYNYLNENYHLNAPDLLRAELINSVSAMDRFIHEIVRIGLIESYKDIRPHTAKCNAFPLRFDTVKKILAIEKNSNPPMSAEETSEYWINKEVTCTLQTMSFQQSEKIKDALSYIWDDTYKLQSLINKMKYSFPYVTINENQKFTEQKLKLIINRRNQIAHEADYDEATHSKRDIDTDWLDDVIIFIKDFVYSIYENITSDTSYSRV